MRRLVSETRIVSSAKRVKFRFALQESDTEERLSETDGHTLEFPQQTQLTKNDYVRHNKQHHRV